MAEEPQDRDRERAAVERDRRVDGFVDPVERGLDGGDHEGDEDRIKRRLRRAAGVIGEVRRTMRGTDVELFRLGRPLGVERAGKPADRRVGVDVAHGDLQRRVELAHARAEARHEERVRAIFGEDIGVDRYCRDAQHALERPAKLALGLGLGRNDLVVEPEPGRLRGRQELAVGLVADQRRDERQALEIGRRHIGWQARAHARDDRRRVRRGRAVFHRIIGDKFGRAGLGLEGRRDRLGDLRNLNQHRLDLGQLDAVAAEFDLRVDAAEILDLAVLGQAAEVAGAIDAARRIVRQGEGVPDELLLSELRPVEIALGDADARDTDFARLASHDRHVLLRLEDDDRTGRQGLADGDVSRRIQHAERRGDGRLGRPVAVEQRAARAAPAPDQRRRAGLAADQDHAQPGQIAIDRGEQGRHAGEAGDGAGLEEVGKLLAEQARRRGVRNERRAGDERDPHFLDREVEGDRHALVDPVAGAEAIGFGGDADEIADARMRDRDALGIAGRARGVEHVAEPFAAAGLLGLGKGRVVEAGDVAAGAVERERRRGEARELVGETQMRDDQGRPGVVEDVAHPVGRMVRIERHIGRARLDEGVERDIGLRAAIEQHADPVARLDAASAEEPRHLVGAPIELAVAEFGAVGRDGDPIGEPAARLLQHIIEPLAEAPAQRRAVGQNGDRLRVLQTTQISQRVALDGLLANAQRTIQHGKTPTQPYTRRRLVLRAPFPLRGRPPPALEAPCRIRLITAAT